MIKDEKSVSEKTERQKRWRAAHAGFKVEVVLSREEVDALDCLVLDDIENFPSGTVGRAATIKRMISRSDIGDRSKLDCWSSPQKRAQYFLEVLGERRRGVHFNPDEPRAVAEERVRKIMGRYRPLDDLEEI